MANKTEISTILIFDALTGEEIIRDLNADEINERKQSEANRKAQLEIIAAQETLRQSALAKLAELGLTEEEINAF